MIFDVIKSSCVGIPVELVQVAMSGVMSPVSSTATPPVVSKLKLPHWRERALRDDMVMFAPRSRLDVVHHTKIN